MKPCDMIAFEESIHDELPVRADRMGLAAKQDVVGGAESVHHEHIAQCGIGFGQRHIVFLFTWVEANVLQQHQLAGINADTVLPIRGNRHVKTQQF